MRRRTGCLLMALCLLTVLSGCARRNGEPQAPRQTLAPAFVQWEAPDGDQVIRKTGDYVLYLPEPNRQELGTRSVRLEGDNLKNTAEELVRRLLTVVNRDDLLQIGRDIELYRDTPLLIPMLCFLLSIV